MSRNNTMVNVIQTTKPRTKRNAQGLVEFALILPILLLVLFGIIDMGWIAFNFSQLYNGLREGTRYGSVVGFGATAQYADCVQIRKTIADLAGFSAVRACPNPTNISIWYDDAPS